MYVYAYTHTPVVFVCVSKFIYGIGLWNYGG